MLPLGTFATFSQNSNFGDKFLQKLKVSHKWYLYFQSKAFHSLRKIKNIHVQTLASLKIMVQKNEKTINFQQLLRTILTWSPGYLTKCFFLLQRMPLFASNYLSKLVWHTISYIYELSLNFASFRDFWDFFTKFKLWWKIYREGNGFTQVVFVFLIIYISFSPKYQKHSCANFGFTLNHGSKKRKNNQFSTTFEDNFNLKPWVSHQMLFPVAKNASLCFKLFIKTGVKHYIIYLWVVPKFSFFWGFLAFFHKIQTLVINI